MTIHKNLKEGWQTFTLSEKMLNIGSELARAINWKNKGNTEQTKNSVFRVVELIDFTIETECKNHAIKEFTRLREIIVDYFLGENIYKTDEKLIKYFEVFYTTLKK